MRFDPFVKSQHIIVLAYCFVLIGIARPKQVK